MRDALHRMVNGKKQLLPISTETFIWALQCACQVHRVPFDAAMVLRQFPSPYNSALLQHALHELGLKGRWRKVLETDLEHLNFPCFAALNPVIDSDLAKAQSEPDMQAEQQLETHGLALLVRLEKGTVLFFEPGSQEPRQLPLTEFTIRCAGHVLQFAAPKSKAVDEDEGKEFGFRWFVPELLKHKKVWYDVLLASLALQLVGMATPLFTQTIIDKVIVHHTMSTLVVIAVGMVIFMVFNAVMSWVRQYLVTHTGNRIDSVLGAQVFAHLFRLPLRYFEHRSTGTLVARLQGIESIREFLSGAAVTLILDVPFLIFYLAIMFYYSWLLSVAALSMLLLIVLLSLAITPLMRERLNQQFLLGARNQSFVTEYLSGMETVKSLQMEPQVVSRYGEYLAGYLEAGFNSRQLSNSYNVAANTLEQMMTLVILCLGAWLAMTTQDFTIGMLVAFQMFAGRLSQPVLRMVGLWQQFQQANIAVKRLGDVMHAPTEPYSLKPAREGGGHGKVEIRNLGFRYADNLPYLYQNFNMSILPGQCIALMGPSGSGKSTLAKLMLGFYLPSEGSIHIDDHDIRHFSANELRHHFGVVPQETVLFSGTLYENLIFSNPHSTFEQVVQACKLAEIHEAIEKLPEGYQTVIGERGVGLSGGQKQRLAIARALLKRPKILLFDEATSSLDSATAEHFAATVNQLKGKVTMLFITHQLPESLKVDEVVRLTQV
ncbi:peptidase domain-containing ABC transporter [Methylobacter sp.]|uniref:peptidase domain-containing ABC transporter n=1 Tax=Methylobacter sp. TaxID=2051955 RepID=UPI002488A0CE|nr:peptidase domain-containing ABC transporter [Methylobacter sp.]MDI1277243.1 peptidase domain-containing ABC transporter [Methylobacter sp.]MDI1357767.1 peptidase domain-containing ABC transporter [Methylobacter sp.]